MKRILSLTILILSLTACRQTPDGNEGKVPTEFPDYVCVRAEVPPVIDGNLDEDVWSKAEVSRNFRDIRGEGWPEPALKTFFKMMYDDENLYIGATLEENNITGSLTGRDDIIWKDNDFEIFIDPYGDGLDYYEFEINALGTVMDLLMTKPYRDGGNFLMHWDFKDLQTAVGHNGTVNDPSDTDKAWYVEIAIPLKSIQRGGASPLEQKVWRMNFSRIEWLKEGGPEENWVWSPTGIVDIHIPGRWGYVSFK